MEATIVPLPTAPNGRYEPGRHENGRHENGRQDRPPGAVRVEGERIVIEGLTLVDPALAAVVAERPEGERAALVERALRIGLFAIADAGVTVNVDVVRAEFERLVRGAEQTNEKATNALEELLRLNFADGDGRLPRTLERFLGDRGALRTLVSDLFDETKRDSALGRMRALLGTYFDGDASKLALLLDPTRHSSPMYQFRAEMGAQFEKLNERLAAIEAAAAARGAERSKSAAKGADFEALLEAFLGDLARGAGDQLDRTADEPGDVLRSKKGDFVLTVNGDLTPGAEVRVVVEAKDRAMSAREMREELREAKVNRSAAVALVAFTPAHAPAGVAPFDVRGGDVYCVVDPADPDRATLEAAVRLARFLAIASVREATLEIDAAAVARALAGVREQLDTIKGLKATLTSIGRSSGEVSAGLDRLRDGVLARLYEAEAELRRTPAG